MSRTCFAFVLLAGAAGPVAAVSPDPKSLAIPPTEFSRSRELVKQLGSEQFDEREEAEQALGKMGRLARPALLEGVNTDPNPEIRSRCSTLLPRASSLEMKARLEVFLADVESKYEHDLPGWNQFRATIRNDWTLLGHRIGSDRSLDRAARGVFAELIATQANRTVVMATGGSRTDLGQIVAARRQELYFQKYPRPIRGGGFRPAMATHDSPSHDPSAEDVAALLFSESLVPSRFVPRTISISNLIVVSGFGNLIRETDEKGRVYRAIAIAWLESRTDPAEAYAAMNTANNLGLPQQSLRLAARLFTAPGAVAAYRGMAASTLVRLGGKEHLPLMENSLTDATLLTTIRRVEAGDAANPNRVVSHDVQTRDVALAVSILLTGQNLEDFGFVDLFKGNTGVGSASYSYVRVYLPEEKRTAAFEKWKEWRAKSEEEKR